MARDRTALLAYTIIVGLLLLLFDPALIWLIRSWLTNPYYSHGFLVPPLAALLAWRQWRRLQAEPQAGIRWPGLLLVIVSLASVVWAMRWQNYVVVSLALIGVLTGLLFYLEGWARLRPWLFPLAFLAFMVPLPFIDLASPRLEAFTARSATGLAHLVGIAAVQQGGEISLPGTTLIVGAPCSGLRSLVTMVTVAAGWIYLVQGRLWAKGLLLVAVAPLVLASNVLRIGLLLVVAELWGVDAALNYYHDWSSPLLFLLALGLLLLLGKVLGCSQLRDDIF